MKKYTVFSKNRPKWFKKQVRAKYGSLNAARGIAMLLHKMAEQGLTFTASWIKRKEALTRLGYLDYKDYLNSSHWRAVRKEYESSKKVQHSCVICKNPKYILHHTDYGYLGREAFARMIPLCALHHSKLHALLNEHGLPMEYTTYVLRHLDKYTVGNPDDNKPFDLTQYKGK